MHYSNSRFLFITVDVQFTLLAGGVTLVSTAIRRRPNAFNFLHQCEMLLGVGASGESAIAGLTVPLPALYFFDQQTQHVWNLP